MSLEPGRMLSHYRLAEKIGQGGMGVVWKATDTKLGREVAIKVLPAELADDPDRLARFEREAKLLASLNHPNVAGIHGLEAEDGLHFLVLELVDGQNLSDIIASGPLPVEEALDVARQVAEGLEAAHAAGVIHRDLKPGNVRVTPDGTAKVLDFGLAKGVTSDSQATASDLSLSPTMTSAGTRDGMILGTAPYMSPEQARAKPLDKRTDIWSFGCLLYECLAGRPAFGGETVTDILSVILQAEPDWSALPGRTSPRVRELLERCLEKNRRNRLHDIGDARIEVERALAGREWTTSGIRAAQVPPAPRRPPWRAAALVAAGILAGAGIGQMVSWMQGASTAGAGAATGVVRFSINAPANMLLGPPLVSPDGRTIAHGMFDRRAEDRQAAVRLYLRRLDSLESVPVEGSEQAITAAFDPEGKWLAFVRPVEPGSSKRKLFKVPVDGSAPPLAIADWPENMIGTFLWSPDGDILATSREPLLLYRFPDDGSPPPPPAEIDHTGMDPDLTLTRLLPGGRTALGPTDVFEESGYRVDLALIDLEAASARVLLRDGSFAAWSPTGHLVVSRGDKLMAVPFDLDRLETTGGPVPIAAGLRTPNAWSGAWFDLSPGGVLAYNPGGIGGSDRRMMVLDAAGEVREWSGARRAFVGGFTISADGRRIAATVTNTAEGLFEIWISDVENPRMRRAVAEKKLDCANAVLSADGEHLAYGCSDNEGTTLYLRRVDGAGEPQVIVERSESLMGVLDLSRDGAFALAGRAVGEQADLLRVPLDGDGSGGEPVVLLSGKLSSASLSPDGRLVALVSSESGTSEVYVRELLGDRLGPPRQVSADGGDGTPAWRGTTDPAVFELFYNKDGRVQRVEVTTGPALRISEPRDTGIDLLELRSAGRGFHPDGRMFFVQSGEEEDVTRIDVVLDFHEEIRRLTAAPD